MSTGQVENKDKTPPAEPSEESPLAEQMPESIGEAAEAPQPEQPVQEEEETPSGNEFTIPKPKKSRKKWIIFAVILIAAGAFAFFQSANRPKRTATGPEYTTDTVQRRSVVQSLSGSSAVSPADSYNVTSLISGDVVSAPFEELDSVEKDDVLYVIDSSSMNTTIERAQLSLEQARRSLGRIEESFDNLLTKSDDAGELISLLIEEGDDVGAGQTIAYIRESSVMQLEVPFSTADTEGFYVGQQAQITLADSFENISGTIAQIGPITQVYQGNIPVYMVKIDVPNPGGLTTSRTATAYINGAACVASGTFAYKSEYAIISKGTGKVERIYYAEGDTVPEKAPFMQLSSSSLILERDNANSSIRDMELNLQSQIDRLEDYTINSPISGTIVEKHMKEGDTLNTGGLLCTIFDMSYLKLVLNVDELDIVNVAEGQRVTITADALKGETYEGHVTKVSINGVTMNSVTAYPVTIRIDEPGRIIPGMNVDAVITISEKADILTVPNSAILRGDRVMVKVREALENESSEDGTLPAGFEYRDVVLGINDDDYVEIVSGLEEGDIVVLNETTSSAPVMFPFGNMITVTED